MGPGDVNLFLSLENWLVDRWQIFYPFWVSLHFCNNIMNIFFIENELLVLRWSFVLITSITHKLTSRTSSIFFQRNRKYLIFHNISDFFLFKLIFRFQLVFTITGAGFSNIPWKYENIVFIIKNPRNRNESFQKYITLGS